MTDAAFFSWIFLNWIMEVMSCGIWTNIIIEKFRSYNGKKKSNLTRLLRIAQKLEKNLLVNAPDLVTSK